MERPPCQDACSSSSDSPSPCLRPLWPQEATIVSRDVPLAGQRTTASASAPSSFDLVGLHWRGTGTVQFRTRSTAGRWSAWEDAAPEAEDRPDAGTAERARANGWRLGNPWWVGRSDRIEYRLRGKVSRLRACFVWSPPAGVPARTLQKAGAPAIVPRAAGSADEKIRRAGPSFAANLRLAIVHHTAGANGYTAAQSPAIVRAIQLYHVKGNGWNDIGYNFLVDRFGTVFEGRYGGIEQNVVGAHAEGFNTGSVGVAVIGEYSSLAVPAKARSSLAALLAWRLDIAHVDPASTQSFISGGNARFAGRAPRLPPHRLGASRHRVHGLSGDGALQPAQQHRAARSSRIGLPKLYAPIVSGAVPGHGALQGEALVAAAVDRRRLRRRRERGGVLERHRRRTSTGPGTRRLVAPGSYTYLIRSDQSVTPAEGVDRRR